MNASEKPLTFSFISTFSSIESLREHIIEKEIESVLRDSHSDQIKWAESRFGLTLTKNLDIWNQFIELTERRNLFVHTDGVVSNQYLSVCKVNKIPLQEDIVEGTKLNVSQKYFNESYSCIFELGVKLAHVLWRKLFPDQRKSADENLVALTYELIERNNFALAIQLLNFSCETFKTFSSEWHQLVLTINRAQAYKWFGNTEKCLDILSEVDWTAKGDEFKLADAVLRTDWDSAKDIMLRIGQNGPVTKLYYRDWSLFREFRTNAAFLETYEIVFNEPFPKSLTAETESNSKNKDLIN